MNFKQLSKLITLENLIIVGTFLLVIIISAVTVFNKSANDKYTVAEITGLLEVENDGSLYYQNVEAQFIESKEIISLRIQLNDVDLEEIEIGNKIYVEKINTSVGEIYNYSGHKRGDTLLWVVYAFIGFLIIFLGKEGTKYIFGTILVLLLLTSGVLPTILNIMPIYISALALLAIISFATILLRLRNLKLASIVSVSQTITLILIFLFNLILFRLTFLIDLFYTDVTLLSSDVSLTDYWIIINTAIIFIAFGVSKNTTLDVAKSVSDKKKKYPTSSAMNLIKVGTHHNQYASARVINSMFFVFLGLSLPYILLSDGLGSPTFWDDPRVVQSIILFINASLSALLLGPITAIISAIALTKTNKSSPQYKLGRKKPTKLASN
ncbi:YibE/F family protein [Candidatus Dojkabacteria bacterium]|uniref:YibE/F family protein n=1 Tax=Candidatus Dojkabacteria bacterium TaxID=2099670 RepID=A0A955RJN9_9BACT|nr:YibE/F family protein [Candidatus Dojkabacteria bacterium]